MHRITSAAVLVYVLVTSESHATDGYWPYGFGTASKGMAGAGVAMALDSFAATINPAAMARVGDRLDLAVSVLYPPRGYTIGPGSVFVPQSVESQQDLFVGPSFGYNRMLDESTSLGVTIYGAGLNTDYPASAGGAGTFLAGKTWIGLPAMFIEHTR